MTPAQGDERGFGLVAAISAFVLWGFMPVYIKWVAPVGNVEVLAHRIVWSAPFLVALVAYMNKWKDLWGVLRDRRSMLVLLATTLLIATNWFVYIIAVSTDRVLEASLGYFINPLLSVALGVVFLRESLTRAQKIAIGLAGLGVLNQILLVGEPPIIALVLATSFGLYGFLRKTTSADSIIGLLVEVALVALPALLYLSWLNQQGAGDFIAAGPGMSILLFLAGPVTVAPLLLFTLGARRLPLSVIGVLQYIGPSLQFTIALFYGEPFTWAHGLTFAFIWVGLALFTWDMRERARAVRVKARGTAPQ